VKLGEYVVDEVEENVDVDDVVDMDGREVGAWAK